MKRIPWSPNDKIIFIFPNIGTPLSVLNFELRWHYIQTIKANFTKVLESLCLI